MNEGYSEEFTAFGKTAPLALKGFDVEDIPHRFVARYTVDDDDGASFDLSRDFEEQIRKTVQMEFCCIRSQPT